MYRAFDGLRSGRRLCAAGVALFVAGAVPGTAEATRILQGGGSIPSGSTSAKLLKKPPANPNSSQQTKMINDPDTPPVFGSTSVFYDRENYETLGFTRVTLESLEPGPGYEITGGYVQLQLFERQVTEFAPQGEPPADPTVVYQDLATYFATHQQQPIGTETGYVQIQFRLTNPEAAGEVNLAPLTREGYQLVDQDGVSPDPNSRFDTHVLNFSGTSPEFNDDEITFTHFANADRPGEPGGVPNDFFIGRDETGNLVEVLPQNISSSTVVLPEPSALGLGAVAGAALLRRRRRPA